MDSRLYFVLGDLFATIFVGAAVGWLSWALIDTGWNMWIAMVIAMLLGMVVATVLFFPLSFWFGAVEIMVACMFSGMLSGMVVGMWCSMEMLQGRSAAAIGSVCGLVGIVIVWIINNHVRGVQARGI